jgi:hypothetical protein
VTWEIFICREATKVYVNDFGYKEVITLGWAHWGKSLEHFTRWSNVRQEQIVFVGPPDYINKTEPGFEWKWSVLKLSLTSNSERRRLHVIKAQFQNNLLGLF